MGRSVVVPAVACALFACSIPSFAEQAPPAVPQTAAPVVAPVARSAGMPVATPATTAATTPATTPAEAPVRSPIAAKAIADAQSAAEADPLLMIMEGLNPPDWTPEKLLVFVNSAKGFGTIGADELPIPAHQNPDLLQEFGCTHVLIKRFHRTQRSVQAAVYTFVGPQGAYGAYAAMREGASTVIVRGSASSEDDRSVSFWKGRHFVVVTSHSDDDEVSKSLVSSLADQLASAINDTAEPPTLLTGMSYLYRVAGSDRFVMGPIAARRFCSLPAVLKLALEKSRGAGFAEYQYPRPMPERMRALVIEYGNPAFAQTIYSGYIETVAEGHKNKKLDANHLLCKLSDSYLLCALQGSKIAIISGARHKESPMMLARQLAY